MPRAVNELEVYFRSASLCGGGALAPKAATCVIHEQIRVSGSYLEGKTEAECCLSANTPARITPSIRSQRNTGEKEVSPVWQHCLDSDDTSPAVSDWSSRENQGPSALGILLTDAEGPRSEDAMHRLDGGLASLTAACRSRHSYVPTVRCGPSTPCNSMLLLATICYCVSMSGSRHRSSLRGGVSQVTAAGQ